VRKNHRAGWKGSVAAVIIGCAALLTAACGGDSNGGSDEDQITDVTREFFDLTINGDPAKAYDLLDSASQADCSEVDFIEQSELAKSFFDSIGEEIKLERVYNIQINGDRATANIDVTVDGEGSNEAGVGTYVRENGEWKMAEGC